MEFISVNMPDIRPLDMIERAVSYEQLVEDGVPLTVVASSDGLYRSSKECDFRLVINSFLDLSEGVVRIIYNVELPPFGEWSSVIADYDEAQGSLRLLADSVISAEDQRALAAEFHRPV